MGKGLLWVERFQKKDEPVVSEHKKIKEKWQELQKDGVDDSPEGIQARLDNIDAALEETERFLEEKKQRVLPPGVR